jgi:ribose transport system permease protein
MMLRGLSQERIVLVLLLTLVILFVPSLVLPGFGTVANRLNLVRSISTLGVMGLAMGLVIISRGIDLSMVSIMCGSWAIVHAMGAETASPDFRWASGPNVAVPR